MRYLYLTKKPKIKIFNYHIADTVYQSDQLINEIEYLSINHTSTPNTGQSIQLKVFQKKYAKLTSIGENTYPLKVFANDTGYKVQINKDRYLVQPNCIRVNIKNYDPIILFGPAMMLNLALNNVFCVHASAFKLTQTTFILMADSGTGKSTIARFMGNKQHGQRIADDIVPLKIKENNLTVLANFPQLKLNNNQQYKGKDINQKIVFLFTEKSPKEIQLKPISQIKGLKKLIKHTVASKLFSEKELNSHLQFCHTNSQNIPCYHLHYSHTKDSLNQLYQLLHDNF